MILLRLMSWPYFRKHVVRTILTTAGIVLGVSVFVAMHTANQSVLFAFNQTVDRIAGKTELEVTAGDSGFSEDVLERVQAASTVRIAVPVIEAIVDSNIAGQGSLLVLGIDMTGDRSLREYDLESGEDAVVDDPLIFLAQPDSLILSKEFADRNAVTSSSLLRLGTVEGDKAFTVRGIMKSSQLTSAFGGNLAVMDVYAAQKMFGRGRTFDRIDLAVKPGTTLAECQSELASLLGPAFQIRPPSGRGQQFEAVLAGYSMMVNISSAFALLIGVFIIYNSFAVAVTQRRGEIGILRALGATRGQIRWLFLGESAVLGLIGSLAGVAFGVLIARAIAASIAGLITDLYGVSQRADEVSTTPLLLMLALGIGVATSLVAAVIPAWNAARVDPVKALQKGRYQVLSAGESHRRAALAAVCGLISVGCLMASGSRAVFYFGYVAAIAVALLLAPLLSLSLAKAIRPALKWLRPIEGALAADSLIQAPRRTSASVAALMLSLALAVAFDGMGRAGSQSIIDWMNTTLDPDLFVLPTPRIEVQTTRFPAAIGTEIGALPGVERVQLLRNGRITFRNTPVMVVAVDVTSVAQTAQPEPVAGNAADMYRRAAAGEGLMVSDNLAQLKHLTLGEVLEIPAPFGLIHLPIVGIIVDYSDQQGSIIMDRSVFTRFWHDDGVNLVRVYAHHDEKIAELRQRILDRYAGQRQVFVMTNAELKSYILKLTGQWFSVTSAQIAVAVLIAILGVVNTLTVSITDRRRELGVLRAVGASHGQIRRTIWIEAMTIGVLGLVLGFVFGAINLYYVLQIVQHDIAGMRLDYQFPVGTALALVPIMLSTAFVAAIWPAESAVRGSLVEALEYE